MEPGTLVHVAAELVQAVEAEALVRVAATAGLGAAATAGRAAVWGMGVVERAKVVHRR